MLLDLCGKYPSPKNLKTPNFFVVEAKRRIFCFLSFTVVFFFSKKERKKSSRTPLGQSSRTPLSLPASKPMMLEAPGPPFIQIRFGVTSEKNARLRSALCALRGLRQPGELTPHEVGRGHRNKTWGTAKRQTILVIFFWLPI